MSARAGSGGFTLLEVLVAVTLFALIGVMLLAGFRTGVRTWEAGEQRSAQSSELRLVTGFVRRRLARAVPLMARDEGRWRLQFSGEPERLRFVTEMSSRLGPGGLYELTIERAAGGGRRPLTLVRRLVHPDTDRSRPAPERDRVVLVDDATALRFSYFGAERRGEQPEWRARWEDRRRLPALVKVELASRAGGAWPALVTRVRTDRPSYQRTAAGASAPAPQPPAEPGLPPP